MNYVNVFGIEKNSLEMQLITAAKYGYIGQVKKLLEEGARVQTCVNAPLREASAKNYSGIVALLINKGAAIYADHNAAFSYAVQHGNLPMMQFLKDHGAYISIARKEDIQQAVLVHNDPEIAKFVKSMPVEGDEFIQHKAASSMKEKKSEPEPVKKVVMDGVKSTPAKDLNTVQEGAKEKKTLSAFDYITAL